VPVLDLMQGTLPTLIRYLRFDLQYRSDLLYRGPFGGGYPAPTHANGDWMAMQWSHADEPKGVPAYAPGVPNDGSDTAASAPVPLISPLHRAMELNPSLRVILMTGMYDGAADRLGCDFATFTVSQVDTSLRGRVEARCYPGGHMMYTDKQARVEMKRDVAALVRGGSAHVAARTSR
jgi:hypothetical protein